MKRTYRVTERGTYSVSRVIEADDEDEALSIFCDEWISEDIYTDEDWTDVREVHGLSK